MPGTVASSDLRGLRTATTSEPRSNVMCMLRSMREQCERSATMLCAACLGSFRHRPMSAHVQDDEGMCMSGKITEDAAG